MKLKPFLINSAFFSTFLIYGNAGAQEKLGFFTSEDQNQPPPNPELIERLVNSDPAPYQVVTKGADVPDYTGMKFLLFSLNVQDELDGIDKSVFASSKSYFTDFMNSQRNSVGDTICLNVFRAADNSHSSHIADLILELEEEEQAAIRNIYANLLVNLTPIGREIIGNQLAEIRKYLSSSKSDWIEWADDDPETFFSNWSMTCNLRNSINQE